jgi:cytoskeletal protein CcmA (bactofilin family)
MSFFGKSRQTESPRLASEPLSPRVDMPQPPVQLPAPVGFETVLGANSTLEGALRSNANVRLDGTFTGTLEITGNVLVGETARINADINAKNISIAGAVRGNVSGKKVQLLRTGRIWGDIRAQALTTEEGAFIDGKITMTSDTAPAPSFEQPVLVTNEPEDATEGEDRVMAALDTADNVPEAQPVGEAGPTEEPAVPEASAPDSPSAGEDAQPRQD